ncbi:hypothetical protein BDW68DRAFT_192856 [Aspergillus falconensis]
MFAHFDGTHTDGGHVNDSSQLGLPLVHWTFANPAPLGPECANAWQEIFLTSIPGLHARGVETSNVLLGVLIFFSGLGPAPCGAAYTDAETGAFSSEFNQATAIYLWAWFIQRAVRGCGGAEFRVLFIDLGILSLDFLLLAVAYMTGNQGIMTAGYSVTMVTAALSYKLASLLFFRVLALAYWAGWAGLWTG